MSVFFRKKMPPRGGVTLLEVSVALGVWLVLSLGVIFAWRYVAVGSGGLVGRSAAFENARGAMDVMLANIRLYDEIRIRTQGWQGYDDVLMSLAIPRYVVGAGGQVTYFPNTFFFDAGLPAGHVRHGRIERSGPGNELARYIGLVQVIYVPGRRIDIIIRTNCEVPIVLEGSACVRFKTVVRQTLP